MGTISEFNSIRDYLTIVNPPNAWVGVTNLNSNTSYYLPGALMTVVLDSLIRAASGLQMSHHVLAMLAVPTWIPTLDTLAAALSVMTTVSLLQSVKYHLNNMYFKHTFLFNWHLKLVE